MHLSEINMRQKAQLEQALARSMSLENFSKQFARLTQIYECFKITSAYQVCSLDETVVSTRTVMLGRAKGVMKAKGRDNAVKVNFKGNAEHSTLMPVKSEDGKVWTLVAILALAKTPCSKRRKSANAKIFTPFKLSSLLS